MSDFDEFFDQHYQRVLGSLLLACGSSSDAEDAAQEAFAKAMVRWSSVERMDRPATWVYVVAVRELRRRLRRGAMQFERDADVDDDGLAAIDVADAVVNAAVVSAALAALAPRQRLAVVLRFHGDLSVRDIATAMGCSEGTVKASLHAALGHLRVSLADRDLEGASDGA
jgi:RNA polymerase sigma factor (sigma-70 family)